MPIYAGASALAFYDRGGQPIVVRDGMGRIISGEGEPLPPLPDYDILQFPEHLSRWWPTLAAADTQRADVLVASNSIGAGYYANDVASVNWPLMDADGYVGLTRSALATRHGAVGDGIMSFGENRSGARVVLTGSPTRRSTSGFGQYGYRLTAGQSITATPRPCTGFRVDHIIGTAAPTYTVDGSPASFTAEATASEYVEAHIIDGLSLAAHTLVIAGPSSGTADVSAFYGRIGTQAHGISVGQSRAPGGYVYDFLPQAGRESLTSADDARLKSITLTAPGVDLLVLAFGHNEWRSGQVPPRAISPSEYADRLTKICTYQTDVNNGSALILAGPDATVLPDSSQTYPQAAYWEASRAVAEANPHVAFLDFGPIFGPHASPPWVDGVHPGKAMHAEMSRYLLGSVFPVGAALAARLAT